MLFLLLKLTNIDGRSVAIGLYMAFWSFEWSPATAGRVWKLLP